MPIYKINRKKDGLQGYKVRVNFIDANKKPRSVEKTAYGIAEAKRIEQLLFTEYKKKKDII